MDTLFVVEFEEAVSAMIGLSLDHAAVPVLDVSNQTKILELPGNRVDHTSCELIGSGEMASDPKGSLVSVGCIDVNELFKLIHVESALFLG